MDPKDADEGTKVEKESRDENGLQCDDTRQGGEDEDGMLQETIRHDSTSLDSTVFRDAPNRQPSTTAGTRGEDGGETEAKANVRASDAQYLSWALSFDWVEGRRPRSLCEWSGVGTADSAWRRARAKHSRPTPGTLCETQPLSGSSCRSSSALRETGAADGEARHSDASPPKQRESFRAQTSPNPSLTAPEEPERAKKEGWAFRRRHYRVRQYSADLHWAASLSR